MPFKMICVDAEGPVSGMSVWRVVRSSGEVVCYGLSEEMAANMAWRLNCELICERNGG